ncbi:MAG: hypothetical protein A3J63_03490 [Candidatus Moranbacteria bacterium RIFCSPHIGHO2_02_FULL_40_12b]|nr:MAG: hypothetical protein A3J63_03490 [Candidatus Moranbacteria bacterium RIFCSPHIGHO2_02_FULL_40_12b]OGI23648.1 MAG: hypothetical protein A3E91_01555 [Candidatus Moranbacteria bacterium RIFCSPHIGHO2_12_FULL_40_10]
MGFTNLPKKHRIHVTFNGNTRYTGKNAILTKISGTSFSKPDETIVMARLDTGEEVQTRILGLVDPQSVISQLGL